MTQPASTLDLFALNGKTVLVTGASSGIGRACAIECARAGARVIITGRHEPRLQEVFNALGEVAGEASHQMIVADLNEDDQLKALADHVGVVDGVVHSAGIDGVAPMHMVSRKMLTHVMDTNYMAPTLLTQRLLFKKKINVGGSIIFMASIAARTGKVGVGPYSASKSALIGSMRPLALEVAKHQIRVNALCPGIVDTPLFEGQRQWLDEVAAATYPLGLGQPEDVAHACVFFLSNASRKVTGTVFSLDGGVHFT